MTNSTTASSAGELDLLHEGAVAAQAQPNALLIAHRLLRGRYWLAILAALIGCAAGAVIGWRLQKPLYQSTGIIRVKPVMPKVLYQNENNGIMPMFASFLQSQLELITNQRLIDMAMQDPSWQALKRGLDPSEVLKFTSSLEAQNPRGSELILVTFTDADPAAAQIGVRAVVEAYDRLYGESDSGTTATQLKALDDLRAKYDAEAKRWKEKVAAIAKEAGTGPDREILAQLHRSKLEQLSQLETQLRSAEIAVALSGSTEHSGAATRPSTSPEDEIAAMSIEDLALRSRPLADLLRDRQILEKELFSDGLRLGEQHRIVVEKRQLLNATQDEIEELSERVRKSLPTAPAAAPVPGGTGKSFTQLKQEQQNLQALYDRLKSEADVLGNNSTEMKRCQDEADAAESMLKEVKSRIEQLDVESTVGGRITIENKGDQPLAPSKDKRKQFAALGGIGLGGLGVALVMGFGFLDRRVQTLDDVRQGQLQQCRILGVLPFLPDDLSDPEQAMAAAHSVHHIRSTLQRRHHGSETPVFGVTSSSPGSGKTSLVVALGLSFAASGSRVLMIDCDIIGGGLTAKMKTAARRRLGDVLRRSGRVTSEQIRSGLQYARHHGQRLGEALIALGYVNESDIEKALVAQEESTLGLREAMSGDPAMECVASLGTPGLHIMPLGSAKHYHAAHLTYAGFLKILEQVKPHFDVILVDTGPVLGSLEASVVAMAADEVVLAVARGEQKPLFNHAYEQLIAAGGRVAGVVLNRADPVDLRVSNHSISTSRMSSRPKSKSEALALPPSVTEHERLSLGPIASAVATLGGIGNNGEAGGSEQ